VMVFVSVPLYQRMKSLMKRKECADSLAFLLLIRLVFLSFYSNLLKTTEVPSRVASSTAILQVTRVHFLSTTGYASENASRSEDIRERLKVTIPHTPPTDQISGYN
jgi:hypothetical protein